MGAWKTWNSKKKCKWICLWSMVVSLLVVSAAILYGMTSHQIETPIVIALIAWGGSMTTTFGLVVAGIHKSEKTEKTKEEAKK